jgi:hypothetical protein
MSDGAERLTELLSVPMESLIVALGRGIGQSQTELDRNSIAVQRAIDEDPVLSQYGLRATWYQMPRTELELKVAVAMESTEDEKPGNPGPTGISVSGIAELKKTLPAKLWLQPVNASYSNQFDYDASASSQLKMTIVPVPPPGAEQVAAATLAEEQVKQLADPYLKKEADGTTLLQDARLSVNFNRGARMWFVIQYREVDDQITTLALVQVDDETDQVVKHT